MFIIKNGRQKASHFAIYVIRIGDLKK